MNQRANQRYERFYGLRVLAYSMMSNHFHILEVPQRPADEDLPDDVNLVARVRSCLGEKIAAGLEWELARFRETGATDAAEALRESWFSRMWNVSTFMKVLKQRFCSRSAQTKRSGRDSSAPLWKTAALAA